jgi:predicted XRE-type DNA-binding protein
MAIHKSSGNVFTDLGFTKPEAANLRVRSILMSKISEWIKENELTQAAAGEVLGISQSRVSDLMRGKIHKFTVDNLLNMLATIGYFLVPVESNNRTSLEITRNAA